VRNVRDELERDLRGHLSDEEWADLVERQSEHEVLNGWSTVAEVADHVRRMRRVYGRRPHPVEDQTQGLRSPEAVSARIDALSAIYGHWAHDESEVRWFRTSELVEHGTAKFRAYIDGEGPYPDFRLVDAAQVEDWVQKQFRAAAPDGDGRRHVETLISQTMPDGPRKVKNLWYIADRQECALTVDARCALGTLAQIADNLAERYQWKPSEAATFVLIGRVPEVFVYIGSASIRHGENAASTRVTMVLDPFLTPQQVAEVYARLRGRFSPQRSMSVKHYRLAQHVGPHVRSYVDQPARVARPGRRPRPGPTGLAWFIEPVEGHSWQSLCRSWNERYGDERTGAGRNWRYDAVRNFNRDSKDALTRLLYPGWQSDSYRAEV
jgi:hypothetical protein